MIDSQIIEKKWHSINVDEVSGFRIVRLSKECKPELNIGFNSEGNRCLILELPIEFSLDINSVTKENLSIEYIKESNYVVIQLINRSYFDLFNDLILSLYHKIKDLVSAQKYANEFVLSFGKWVEFFENRIGSGLSLEEIKGLYGELFILNEFLSESDSNGVNEIMESWVGLYDAPQDFDFHQQYIEVKTKLESNSMISISSEYQLAVDAGKELYLTVVTIMTNYDSGKSLHDLILETAKLIREKLGDLSILYAALNEKRLTLDSLIEYNNYRYSVIRTSKYDCGSQNFPRLTKSNVPNAISRLKYNIDVNQLDEFLISEKKY